VAGEIGGFKQEIVRGGDAMSAARIEEAVRKPSEGMCAEFQLRLLVHAR
jgi:hypothetical protein